MDELPWNPSAIYMNSLDIWKSILKSGEMRKKITKLPVEHKEDTHPSGAIWSRLG
jgi:hypothetical protein